MSKAKTAARPARRSRKLPAPPADACAALESLSPRAQRRRQEILDAATALFLEKGFTGCSIDDVIRRTGGSKRTVYKLFPRKRDLFAAIAQGCATKILCPIEMPELPDRPIDEVLTEFGENFLQVMTSNEFAQLYRAMVSEAANFPDAACGVFEAGPARVRAAVMEVLAHYEARGDIAVPDRELAAEQFVSMLRTEYVFSVAIGVRPPPSKETIRRTVAQAVSIFLDGCRKRA